MHRPRTAALLVASLSFLFQTVAKAEAPDALARAQALLARDDARGAVAVVEGALTEGGPAQAELLDLLRRAYPLAARQAEADGKADEAEMYRDNLEILGRNAPAPREAPAIDPIPAQDLPETPAAPEPKEATPSATADLPVRQASLPSETPQADAPEPEPPPAETPSQAGTPPVTVAAADAAFVAKRYDEAGRLYAALDGLGQLPKTRRDHWAYCRWVDVVRRINAHPDSSQEWESIDAEIMKIRALSPKNWFGEYLRHRASDRTYGRRAGPSNRLVVRGSAPDEPTPPPSATGAAAPPAARPAANPPAARPTAAPGNWQVVDTANFRIFHADPALAARVAKVAEAARESQVKCWSGAVPKAPWSPRCDIYVYPNAKVFSRMTGQPEQSPGFSTMGMNAGRIIARRVNLRADHPKLLAAILPHEITHVVLADLFPHQQIPRWADEGMAVLAEPPHDQHNRAADLEKPLAAGQLFKLNDLMVMDYPDGDHWGLYYAQSVSLTRFLVEQGTPVQFVQFVQGSQRNGFEDELRRVYKIEGFADLQKRWLDYARAKSAEMTASANSPGAPDTSSR